MTDEQKSFIKQFEELKDKASKKDKDIVKDLEDCVDTHYFYSLSALFQLQRLNAVREKDVEAHCVQLCNRYTADKGVHERYKKIEQENLHRRMKSSEVLTQLIKTADTITELELYELFIKLIASAFDDVSARTIQEKLTSRSDEKMLLICEKESEGYIRELLLSFRVASEDISELISAAKRNGMSAYGGYKVTYEGEKFNLYRIPGVILC